MLGWGKQRDTSTAEERAAWKANAEKQMEDANNSADDGDDGDTTPRHRRARNPR
jgi:hypothetical protein